MSDSDGPEIQLEDSKEAYDNSVGSSKNAEEEKVTPGFFMSAGESLLSKMGGSLLAKAFLPSGAHVK